MVCGIVLGKAKTTKVGMVWYEFNIVNQSINESMTEVGIELLGQLKTIIFSDTFFLLANQSLDPNLQNIASDYIVHYDYDQVGSPLLSSSLTSLKICKILFRPSTM